MHGDVSFLELGCSQPDTGKSQQFFTQVFDWPFHATPQGGGWFQASRIRIGLHGNDPGRQIYVFLEVSDLKEAMALVRDAGGEADAATLEPGFGQFCNCRDPQGIRFGLHQKE